MSIYDFELSAIDNTRVPFSSFKGKTLLIVNVASKCGFTPQYTGLEALYRKYKDRGFLVLGFPCNQFGNQEPGKEEDIATFCDLNYQISFPLFAKIEVNGPNTHPLYKYLKEQKTGILGISAIKWNFTKFLVNKNGEVIKRYAPSDKPEDIDADIEKIL